MDFDDLLRLAAGNKFPLCDRIFRGFEQDWAAALWLHGLHIPVRRHDRNHLDGAAEIHLSCEVWVSRDHLSKDFPAAFIRSLLTLGRSRWSKAVGAEKEQYEYVPRLHDGDP